MPILKRIRFVSLIIFWPALAFGLFAAFAGDLRNGIPLLSLAAAAGLWAVVCSVADRVVALLESMDWTMKQVADAVKKNQSDGRKAP
ncbi:hypothetical protein GCM10007291_49720 [Gemmobacter nanjingensis]|jgi:hypothetical protein|uniref:Uncharacterized protein n=1 Tax=Gemmobacter nanjingensis TaxID=488454 RepID=A0ABQ3FTX6_9RHOB|nr:hypothetical protein [Gemmobacter nanjingensis]GHC41879.1 hypothetical protein GCM10007291_49720 [Gemmobacter nanjingensis]